MNMVDQFVVGVVKIGERHKKKSQSRVLKTEKTNLN
jgi:hypothetical protein